MTLKEVVMTVLPDADDELCDYILWGRTPFPLTRVTARMLYKAADRHRRVVLRGNRMCDFCHRLVDKKGASVCPVCDKALNQDV